MKVLGVSGSPIDDGNTDSALKTALAATGMDTEFVKLKNYNIEPCRACLKCVNTNVCVINDAGNILAQKAKNADALIVAGYTPYSTLDSRSKAFIERLYPLRHKYGFMQGKPGGAVITCAVPGSCEMLPPVCDNGVNAVMYYMMEEGMNFVGSATVLGNLPCIKCGYGDECDLTGIKMMYGNEATVKSVGVNRFEDQPEAVEAAKTLGKNIAEALKSNE
ncbi:NADPH-dependent FMN reductase [Methanohalobium evestigatum Z-7303]|uniref:NADPH-dependent FMN reductase n=1 Tax=Methanohalobium evestigatum (strain ATCC BAA-1072 / DSM 3721 / NBRC 107634 / OCM 161 / Z-7303) TaxID=644295 RepID=D7EBG2_METEZ|nr:flavodoxin family protein [Methanohalobium evestigatum]ADI74804.1 NADPH-dependent FMN reductase [Methanohalobium evestigatum Z-7303]